MPTTLLLAPRIFRPFYGPASSAGGAGGDNVKTAFRDGFFPDVSNDTLSGVNNF